MATTTHYIYSHYDPKDRETLEEETGQHAEDDLGPEEVWQREASRISRQRGPAPQFVPATISYDEWSSVEASTSELSESTSNTLGNSLSGWYRSLTSSCSGAPSTPTPSISQRKTSSDSPLSSLQPAPLHAVRPKPQDQRNKNNWFILKAIDSEPPSTVSTSTPSLADILARDPPPLPSDEKYTPPVWLEIGPSNKGFGMLQRSGWNEGEPLGPGVIRRKPVEGMGFDGDIIRTAVKGRSKIRENALTVSCGREMREVKMENFDDVSELRQVDVIDLTQSDSDSDGELSPDAQDDCTGEEGTPGETEDSRLGAHMLPVDNSAYGRKALLTPIATVLKSDRLGIGLKAKTVGPYKASQKRVTHSAAALAAHVRVAEENRRRQKLFGRGAKGFQRRHQAEEERRKAMAAHLKTV